MVSEKKKKKEGVDKERPTFFFFFTISFSCSPAFCSHLPEPSRAHKVRLLDGRIALLHEQGCRRRRIESVGSFRSHSGLEFRFFPRRRSESKERNGRDFPRSFFPSLGFSLHFSFFCEKKGERGGRRPCSSSALTHLLLLHHHHQHSHLQPQQPPRPAPAPEPASPSSTPGPPRAA